MKYQWQGEKIKVIFGNCIVRQNKEKPLYWYNFECYPEGLACIPAIKIIPQSEKLIGTPFVIANHYGIGVYKLLNGGWPNYTHFSLDGEFSTKPRLKITEFDPGLYAIYESEREEFFKEHHPEEWKAIQPLRKMGQKLTPFNR